MLIAVAALALGSAVVPQSGAADLECVLDRLTSADRLAVANEALQDSSASGPASKKLENAATTCATQRRWNGEYAGAVSGIAFAVLVGEQAELELANAGIETKVIDAWFGALSAPGRARVLDDSAGLERLAAKLEAAGTPADHLEANGELIGLYVGALVALERIERGLPL